MQWLQQLRFLCRFHEYSLWLDLRRRIESIPNVLRHLAGVPMNFRPNRSYKIQYEITRDYRNYSFFRDFGNPDGSVICSNRRNRLGPFPGTQANIIFKDFAKKLRQLWSRSKRITKQFTGVALEHFTGRAPHVLLNFWEISTP